MTTKGNKEQLSAIFQQKASTDFEVPKSVISKPLDWLRSFSGFEHYSEKQALETIHTLEKLAHILLSVTTTNQANPHEEP